MEFNSADFLIFFPIISLLYFMIPKKLKSLWLLGCSYYFYMCWNPVYIFLLFATTLMTYFSGLGIAHFQGRRKKLILIITIILNVLMLGYYKYLSFLTDALLTLINPIFHTSFENHLSILLPVGISFFIFQSIGYTVDVYRGKLVAEKNFIKYALFVSFFPQLVAGPIERATNLLPQIHRMDRERLWSLDGIIRGFILMIWGLFLKVYLADHLAIIVDNAFTNYQNFGTLGLFTGAAAFSLQIYCDFAGYSTIAMGAAKVLGIRLMENFNTPYFSRSMKEFWNRWHISLSNWLKDYVYFPLGGSRCSKLRHYLNLMITFLISGVWHGAGWNYVLWGFLHGLYQIIERITAPVRQKLNAVFEISTESFSHQLLQMGCTFLLTTFAWIFFRADSLSHAFAYLRQMLHPDFSTFMNNAWPNLTGTSKDLRTLIIGLAILLIVSILRKGGDMLDDFLMKQSMFFRIFVMIILIVLLLKYGIYGTNVYTAPFVYFQF